MNWKQIVNMKSVAFGAAVGTLTYIFSLMYTAIVPSKTINIGNYVTVTGSLIDVNVRHQIASSGAANAIGVKVMQLLNQIPYMNWGDWLTIVLGSIVIVMLGKWMYSFLPKNAKFRLAVELLYGAIAGVILIGLLGGIMPTLGMWTLIVNFAVYYLLVAIIIQMLSTTMVGKYFRTGE